MGTTYTQSNGARPKLQWPSATDKTPHQGPVTDPQTSRNSRPQIAAFILLTGKLRIDRIGGRELGAVSRNAVENGPRVVRDLTCRSLQVR